MLHGHSISKSEKLDILSCSVLSRTHYEHKGVLMVPMQSDIPSIKSFCQTSQDSILTQYPMWKSTTKNGTALWQATMWGSGAYVLYENWVGTGMDTRGINRTGRTLIEQSHWTKIAFID